MKTMKKERMATKAEDEDDQEEEEEADSDDGNNDDDDELSSHYPLTAVTSSRFTGSVNGHALWCLCTSFQISPSDPTNTSHFGGTFSNSEPPPPPPPSPSSSPSFECSNNNGQKNVEHQQGYT
jgi:hypothetical protein